MIFQLFESVRGWLMPFPFWIKELGPRGEYLARRHFHRRGYHLLERNWRRGKGEIDLIMARPEHLLFLEVKTRRNPLVNLDRVLGKTQERRLLRLAENYLHRWPEQTIPWRFELVLISVERGSRYQLRSAKL